MEISSPVTGDLSSFVSVSFFTSLLNTESVSMHALRTAAMATCFSDAKGIDIVMVRVNSLNRNNGALLGVYAIGRVKAVKGRP
jgi:hypothetical protein